MNITQDGWILYKWAQGGHAWVKFTSHDSDRGHFEIKFGTPFVFGCQTLESITGDTLKIKELMASTLKEMGLRLYKEPKITPLRRLKSMEGKEVKLHNNHGVLMATGILEKWVALHGTQYWRLKCTGCTVGLHKSDYDKLELVSTTHG